MAPLLPREAGEGDHAKHGGGGAGARPPLPALAGALRMRRQPDGGGAMAKDVMNKVRVGRTDLMVTPIGFGTSGLGDMPDTYGYGVDAERAKATVLRDLRRAGQFHRYVAHLWHGPQRGADRRRHPRARRPAAGLRRLDQARPRPQDQPLRRRPGPPLARAEPEGAGARARRPPASARSRACPFVQGGDRARRRARRALPDQGGGAGEGGRPRRRDRDP